MRLVARYQSGNSTYECASTEVSTAFDVIRMILMHFEVVNWVLQSSHDRAMHDVSAKDALGQCSSKPSSREQASMVV